ncbi:TM2 domain containing protein [Histomonas meleagridis]|uniref:TM2 domain containing protein n=1 Tax=Histomonas meleagridis TaxID=135588 RepID=UPI00355ACCF1|nr:TM2 domain containing protein [Histomonas meleagridis]KAH0796287.1 TM2 domain containing protein [Histomonas meleagridis]
MLFLLLALSKELDSIPYRSCNHTDNEISNCTTLYWDGKSALIPCSQLPKDFRECKSSSLKKFQQYFPDLEEELPADGCQSNYQNINSYGIAVCQPLRSIECIGERYWIAHDYRCFKEGTKSYITAFLCSLFFGVFGADRFYLGYVLLGVLKLLTLGGVGVWYFVDLILVSIGKVPPNLGDRYKNSY